MLRASGHALLLFSPGKNITYYFSTLTTIIAFSCIFPRNTVGAKHNPNSRLQKQCLPEEVQNVHKHVLCFPKDTCQNPADASSIGKYLAQAMSPKISPLVGSGKYSFFNILVSFCWFSLHKQMLLSFPAVMSNKHSYSWFLRSLRALIQSHFTSCLKVSGVNCCHAALSLLCPVLLRVSFFPRRLPLILLQFFKSLDFATNASS